MISGQDFPSIFDRDNFTKRRTTGHNWYDPESLITGAEIAQGFTATNSARNWQSEQHYHLAVSQELSPEQIAVTAPRVLRIEITGLYECFAVAALYSAQFV